MKVFDIELLNNIFRQYDAISQENHTLKVIVEQHGRTIGKLVRSVFITSIILILFLITFSGFVIHHMMITKPTIENLEVITNQVIQDNSTMKKE